MHYKTVNHVLAETVNHVLTSDILGEVGKRDLSANRVR